MNRVGYVAMAALLAQPAFALEFGNGFSVVGEVALEYVDSEGSSETFGFGDVTFGWRSQAGGQLGFGLDLTVDAVTLFESGETLSNVWGGAVLVTGFGEFTVGVPRPILDTWLDTPPLGGSRIADIEISASGSGGSYLATLLLFGGDPDNVYGATFKGGNGTLDYGLGVHRVEEGGNGFTDLEFAVRYRVNQLELHAGLELMNFDSSSTSLEGLTLGAVYSADRWSAGVQGKSLQAGPEDITVVKLFGDYEVTEALTLGVQATDTSEADDTFYGVNADYSFGSGAFAGLGYVRIQDSDLFSAQLGFRF